MAAGPAVSGAVIKIPAIAGRNTIQPIADVIPLIIKAKTGQTANLTEWQDSTGTVKAGITAAGAFFPSPDLSTLVALSPASSTRNVIQPTGDYIPLVVKGQTGQTQDLQEWQASDGSVRLQIGSDGQIGTSASDVSSASPARFNVSTTGHILAQSLGTGTDYSPSSYFQIAIPYDTGTDPFPEVISLRIKADAGTPTFAGYSYLYIYGDTAGAPGAFLGSMVGSPYADTLSTGYQQIDFTPAGYVVGQPGYTLPFPFQPNTRYWFVLDNYGGDSIHKIALDSTPGASSILGSSDWTTWTPIASQIYYKIISQAAPVIQSTTDSAKALYAEHEGVAIHAKSKYGLGLYADTIEGIGVIAKSSGLSGISLQGIAKDGIAVNGTAYGLAEAGFFARYSDDATAPYPVVAINNQGFTNYLIAPDGSGLQITQYATGRAIDVRLGKSTALGLVIIPSGGQTADLIQASGFKVGAAGAVTAPSQTLLTTVNGTNTVVNLLSLDCEISGTPAAGYGTGVLFQGKSSTTTSRSMARVRTEWTTATDASRVAKMVLSVFDTTERDIVTLASPNTYFASTVSVGFGGVTSPNSAGAVGIKGQLAFWDGTTYRGTVATADNNVTGGASTDLGIQSFANIVFSTGGATKRLTIDSNGQVLVNGFTAATVGLVVKGTASQSADLQEWQDSSGNILAYVSNIGRVVIYARDAATTTVLNSEIVAHFTSGTPTTGFGTAIALNAHSSTNTERTMARVRTEWTTAIDASRVARMVLSVFDTAENDVLSLGPTGVVTIGPALSAGAGLAINRTATGTILSFYPGGSTHPGFNVDVSSGSIDTVSNGYLLKVGQFGNLNPTNSVDVITLAGGTFNPTSGAAAHSVLRLIGTINQVGSTGISRGLWVTPTLTATADYRGIEVADVTGHYAIKTGTGKHLIGGDATANTLIGLYGKAPDVQPTTAITAAAFVANTSGIANDTATWGGYTIGQVVAALKRLGALA